MNYAGLIPICWDLVSHQQILPPSMSISLENLNNYVYTKQKLLTNTSTLTDYYQKAENQWVELSRLWLLTPELLIWRRRISMEWKVVLRYVTWTRLPSVLKMLLIRSGMLQEVKLDINKRTTWRTDENIRSIKSRLP